MNNLFRQGFLFTALGKFSILITNLLVNAVLSRMLSPGDFGIVAVVQVFILFFQMLVEAGMGPAIIQNKKLSSQDIGILFNYSVFLAIILSLSFGLFGQVLARIYYDNIYIKIAWLQSIAIFFNGLNVIPSAILNREKRFKEINVNQIIASVLSGTTGIILAYLGYGVYSLIMSSIILSITFFMGNLFITKIKFTKELNYSVLKKILSYSVHQFSFNFINYFSRNADNMLIGRLMGSEALGNYSKAYQLLMMPNSLLLGIINPVMQPILSDYSEDVITIKKFYLKIVRILALIGGPLSVYLSIYSEDVIFFIFGNQWTDAVYPFKVLSLTVWIQMTLSSTGAIFQSRNKPRELFITGLISAFVIVGGILIGIQTKDLNQFSIILAITFVVNYFINFSRVMKLALEDTIWVLLKEFKIPIFITIIESIVLFFTSRFITTSAIPFVNLLISGTIFFAVLVVILAFLGELNEIKELLKKDK